MIQDSVPWKDELLRVAVRLERKRTQKRWTERSGFLVERDVMISAFAMRRLIEAWKVSDKLCSRSFTVEKFDLIGAAPDFMSRFHFWEIYDLERSDTQIIGLKNLCNQIIHSWMWAISSTEDDEFDGIYVSSDRTRMSLLYKIPIQPLIEIIRDIGREDVVQLSFERATDAQFRKTSIEGILLDTD